MITVIVPVYNVEAYLRECLDSISIQTEPGFEALLVDDGSTDASASICGEYLADPHFRLFSKSNGGLSSARNYGIERANGDLLAFVDSDDVIAPDYLRVLESALLPGCDLSVCGLRIFKDGSSPEFPAVPKSSASPEFPAVSKSSDVAGRESSASRSDGDKPAVGFDPVVLSGKEAARRLFGSEVKTWCTAWNKLYRRELFSDIRFPEGRLFEDSFTIPKVLLEAGSVGYTEYPAYGYRDRAGSITNTYSARHFDAVEAVETIYLSMPEGELRALALAYLARTIKEHYVKAWASGNKEVEGMLDRKMDEYLGRFLRCSALSGKEKAGCLLYRSHRKPRGSGGR